jgi:hypothetical protein
MVVSIKIEGREDFPVEDGWTANEVIEEIRLAYSLRDGYIKRNGVAMRSTSKILEKDEEGGVVSFEFVGFQNLQQSQQGKFHTLISSLKLFMFFLFFPTLHETKSTLIPSFSFVPPTNR